MIDERDLLERAGRQVSPPEHVMEGLYRRRDRKRRNQRVGAMVVSVVIVGALIAIALTAFGDNTEPVPATPPITATNVGSLQEIGLTPTDGLAFRMAVANDVLVVGTGQFKRHDDSGGLVAYQLPCGGDAGVCQPLWTARTDGAAIPTIADGVVYATGLRGRTLYAFDIGCASDGSVCAPRWVGRLDGEAGVPRPPLAHDGTIYVGTTTGVMAFQARCTAPCSGRRELTTDQPVRALAADGTILYAGTGAFGEPAGGGGLGGSLDGSLYGFDITCGSCRPSRQDVGQVWDLAVSQGTLFVGTNGPNGIVAFDTACLGRPGGTCGPLWTAQTSCCTQLEVEDGLLIAHDHVDAVYEFPTDCRTDGAGCEPTWASRPAASNPFVDFDRPTIDGDVAYVGGQYGTIYAFPTGCSDPCPPAWEGMGGVQSFDAVAMDTRLYVTAENGLHVFAPGDSQPAAAAASKSNAARFYGAVALIGCVVLIVALIRRRRNSRV